MTASLSRPPSTRRGRWLPAPASAGPASVSLQHDAAALLADVGRGDCEAFGLLYDLLAPRVFGASRAVAGTGAEEATLAAFVEVWRRAPEWPGGNAAAAIGWALRVVADALAPATAPAHRGGKRSDGS